MPENVTLYRNGIESIIYDVYNELCTSIWEPVDHYNYVYFASTAFWLTDPEWINYEEGTWVSQTVTKICLYLSVA